MFDEFIVELKKIESTMDYTNQYNDAIQNSDITTNNLKQYLNYIYSLNPEYIFVGEAPGYNGCRITGVPFTDEYILTKDFGNGIFGKKNGYKIINEENPSNELTATYVWETFNKNKWLAPCFWNSFPFHPFENRTPNAEELKIGKIFLDKFIRIFLERNKGIKFVAIGREAERLLKKMSIDCNYIRHPSHGGINEFISGIMSLRNKL
jgi:uracil-DNA glycosylase